MDFAERAAKNPLARPVKFADLHDIFAMIMICEPHQSRGGRYSLMPQQ